MLVWRRQHSHTLKLDIALLDGVKSTFLYLFW